MSDKPLMNDAAARSPEGEILDQQDPPEQQSQEQKTSDQTESGSEKDQTQEKKPEDKVEEKPGEKKEDPKDKSLLNKKGEKAAKGAPEKYELKAPEGYELIPAAVEKASETFKKLGLTQESAQELLNLHAETMKANSPDPLDAYRDMRKGWRDEVKKDPDIGHRIEEVRETISRALDTLGKPELVKAYREAMDLTGAGDHPAFIKVINALSEQVVEGRHVKGGGPSEHGQNKPGDKPSAAKALYPNLK